MIIEKLNYLFYETLRILIYICAKLYFRIEVIGAENLPEDKGIILVSNHCSHLDPPLISAGIKKHLNFLAKAELFNIFLFKNIITALGAIPIERGKKDSDAINRIMNLLENKKNLLIFPEGTRSNDGNLKEIPKSGIGFILKNLDATVVPVYVKGSFDALKRGSIFPKPVKIKVYFGKPVEFKKSEIEHLSSKAIAYTVMAQIKKQIEENK